MGCMLLSYFGAEGRGGEVGWELAVIMLNNAILVHVVVISAISIDPKSRTRCIFV